MKRCAIYIRVSTEEQTLHGYSLEAQKETLTEYAKENDMLIVDYYADEGFTARKKVAKRKEFQRMISDVKSGKIDIIIFTKLDRWFRSISDYYVAQEVLEANNINWKTVLENYDTSTASGRLHINIMLSVAQDEADRTSERIKFVFENKVRNGEVVTGSSPLGYRIENKRLVIDKEIEPIIRDAFDYFETHSSIRGTMYFINAKYNTKLAYAVIQRVIKNTCYCGIYKDNQNYCDPYISTERYDKLQRLIKTNQRIRSSKRTYIFSGLLVCGECGKRLSGNTSINRCGTEYHHYICYNSKVNKICKNSVYINENIIDDYLLNNIELEINNYVASNELETSKQYEIDNSKEINRKLERLKDLYINEKISMEEYSVDYDKIKSQLVVADSSKKIDINELKKFLESDYKAIYISLNDTAKQALWRSVLKGIVTEGKEIKEIIFI